MAAPRSKGLWPAVKILLLRVATPGFAPGRHLIALPLPSRRTSASADISSASYPRRNRDRARALALHVAVCEKEYIHIPARSDYDPGVISVPAAAPATVACIGEYRPNHHDRRHRLGCDCNFAAYVHQAGYRQRSKRLTFLALGALVVLAAVIFTRMDGRLRRILRA